MASDPSEGSRDSPVCYSRNRNLDLSPSSESTSLQGKPGDPLEGSRSLYTWVIP